MRCLNCNVDDIEADDNFCYNCGHWTARGYNFFKDENNQKMIENGQLMKQNFKLGLIVLLLFLGIITFLGMYAIQGQNLFLPFTYLKNSLIIWCMDIIL